MATYADPTTGSVPRDPTAVMGKRIGAWVVDSLLILSVIFLFSPLGAFGDHAEIPESISGTRACEGIRDTEDVGACLPVGSRAYFVENSVTAMGFAAAVGWFVLVYVIWQGLTGATPGKTLFGVRVVDPAGQPPGPKRSFVRSILWVVDAAPWVLPLVGLSTALTSTGHRRVGDMAVQTFVVGLGDTGKPVDAPGL